MNQTWQIFKRGETEFTIDDSQLKQSSSGESFLKKYRVGDFIAAGGYGIVCKGKSNIISDNKQI